MPGTASFLAQSANFGNSFGRTFQSVSLSSKAIMIWKSKNSFPATRGNTEGTAVSGRDAVYRN